MSWRASSGLRSWLLQRLTALYIVVFLVILVAVWGGQALTYDTWRAWVAHPAANIALLLFVVALLLHAWIGGRDVIIDYIHSVGGRYVLLIVYALGMIVMGLWSLRILFSVTAA